MLSVWCLVPGNYPTARRLRPLRSLIEDRTIAEKSIDLILVQVLTILEEYFKKLRGRDDIWEVRVQHGNNIFRLLGFFEGENVVVLNHLDFGQNERVLGQKTRERENAKTGQRKELDTVSFSTMADWINNSVL